MARASDPARADTLDLDFLDKILPYIRALRGYTRLKVDGLEHVPQEGPAILAANHTGWLGLDYALAALILHDEVHRIPRGLVHQAWFVAPQTAQFAAKVGLTKVSKDAMADELRAGNLVVVFPEGEKGAFRPGSNYQLSEFARGFVRVAMAEKVPIVPVAILGGEESNPVDRTIDSYEQLLKMPIPVPRNLMPKPVKWRIRFLPPVDVAGQDPGDHDAVHGAAQGIQSTVQEALDQLKVERGNPYF
ncbi:MAG: lysophospholipid acyltransferase family protein [bacterium]